MLKSPGFHFILWQVPSDEVVGEWLRLGWYLPYVEDIATRGSAAPGSIIVPALSG
jgi:hypothetical protein